MSHSNDLMAKAVELAARHHSGQTDKGGHPYILHPLRVMMRVSGLQEKMVAVMHDLIEDCGFTVESLQAEGFPPAVAEAVDCLSRREGESYMEFVRRVKPNPLARTVKMADIADNMDLSRISNPTPADHARVEKYRQALELLREA